VSRSALMTASASVDCARVMASATRNSESAACREEHKREPNRLIFQAADSLFLVADAITRAQSTEADAVIKALRDTRFEGSQGLITFEKEPGLYFQQWKNIPYITYQLTARGQQLPETLLIQGPGVELSVDKLIRPAR
jgi:branched-chain amino acid transport system substrate-binding protein